MKNATAFLKIDREAYDEDNDTDGPENYRGQVATARYSKSDPSGYAACQNECQGGR